MQIITVLSESQSGQPFMFHGRHLADATGGCTWSFVFGVWLGRKGTLDEGADLGPQVQICVP